MNLAFPPPPKPLVKEIQQRIVLLINHILQQEPEAMARLKRQKGQIARMEYAQIALNLVATPAGLLDLTDSEKTPDLTLKVLDTHPFVLAQTLLRGDKPRMEISGDVILAAEVNWLVDHVRWDIEDDLARILGDVPAHGLMQALRSAQDALRQLMSKLPTSPLQERRA